MDLSIVEQRWASLLSVEQQEFVKAFVVTQSAAGASDMVGIKKSQGARYMKSPTILSAIKLAQKAMREGVAISPEEVICDLRLIRDMALGRIAAPQTNWSDGVATTTFVKHFNPQAANKAVENLGRVIGSFTDKKEITIPATDRQLQNRLEELLGVKLDAVQDAEFETVPDTPEAPEPIPALNSPENPIPEPPESLSAAFEALADDELTALLAKACDEQGF